MKLIDRILLTIYSFFVGICAILLMFVPISTWASNWTSHLLNTYSMHWQNSIISVFFIGISVRLLFSGFKYSRSTQSVVRHTTFGEVNISLQAIEGMAQKSAKIVPGLRDIKAIAKPSDDGLTVEISALALSDINIPEASIKVQENIKEYIEDFTGINVKEIKVKINNLAQSKGRVE